MDHSRTKVLFMDHSRDSSLYLGEGEERVVDVDILVRRRLHDRDVERLEVFAVHEILEVSNHQFVGLVAFGRHYHHRLLRLQNVVEDLHRELD